MNDIDWIQGDKFETIADVIFAPKVNRDDDYSCLKNTLTLDRVLLKDPCVVYTHTMYVKQLFDVIKDFNHRFVVVTHNSDDPADFEPPDNVIKWFSTNVNIMHDRVESIPIGIQNDRWLKVVDKKQIMLDKLKEPRVYKNLVYMNHNTRTNPANRVLPYAILSPKSWVTTHNGTDFNTYIDSIYNHKFVVCPEGHGIDSHRIWECLYIGTIPIVENNVSAELLYSYFPCEILFKDWGGLTEDLLNNEFNAINKIKSYFSIEKMLTFEYWKNKILSVK